MTSAPSHLQSMPEFSSALELEGASEKTLKSYASDLKQFAQWFESSLGETFSPTAITPTDIREYRSFLINVEQRQPATVNRHLASLRKFCLWAQDHGLLQDLPTRKIKGVASSPRSPRSLEKREVDRLIRAAEKAGNKRDLAIISTLRHTGIRVSELCSLRLGDVELAERKGSLVVRSGKGGRFRVLPLNVDVRKAIGEYLAVRPKGRSDQLYLGRRGDGLKTEAVLKIVAKYAGLAQLEGVTPHTLRHSFAKHTLDSGTGLVAVAALLGHQRLETTAIYTTPSARDLEKAVDRLAAE